MKNASMSNKNPWVVAYGRQEFEMKMMEANVHHPVHRYYRFGYEIVEIVDMNFYVYFEDLCTLAHLHKSFLNSL
jgi:hypothetical protein